MDEIVGGTVIERSFISRETTNVIHAASVPLTELGTRPDNDIEDTLVDLLGIPRETILDEQGYSEILNELRNYPPDYIYPFGPFSEPRYRTLWRDSGDKSRSGILADFLSATTTDVSAGLEPWIALRYQQD